MCFVIPRRIGKWLIFIFLRIGIRKSVIFTFDIVVGVKKRLISIFFNALVVIWDRLISDVFAILDRTVISFIVLES
jgi:hypothetical protein